MTCASTGTAQSFPGLFMQVTACPELLYPWILVQMRLLDLYLLPDAAK